MLSSVFLSALCIWRAYEDVICKSTAVSASLFSALIAFLLMIFRADAISVYLFYALRGILAVIIVVNIFRVFTNFYSSGKVYGVDAALIVGSLCLSAFLLYPNLNFPVYSGHRAISISPPLGEGSYIVVQGGANFLVNDHRSYSKATAQSFAVDLVKLSDLGRSNSTFVSDPSLQDFYIYGAPVKSPCDGRIIFGADGFGDDVSDPVRKENPAGNFLAIACNTRITVVVAHLQKEMFAKVGDSVAEGTELGLVGNSGNSTEPHLHIHAISGVAATEQEALFTGNGIPLQIHGSYLYRNSVLRLGKLKERFDER